MMTASITNVLNPTQKCNNIKCRKHINFDDIYIEYKDTSWCFNCKNICDTFKNYETRKCRLCKTIFKNVMEFDSFYSKNTTCNPCNIKYKSR